MPSASQDFGRKRQCQWKVEYCRFCMSSSPEAQVQCPILLQEQPLLERFHLRDGFAFAKSEAQAP